MAINGKLLTKSQTFFVDSQGNPLTASEPGIYILKPHQVWLMGTHHERSWDSRYFGAIDEKYIQAVLVPLFSQTELNKMKTKNHSVAEGQRVHYLANLGGLVVIAGLENYPPNLLVGGMAAIHKRLQQLSPNDQEKLKGQGDTILKQRAADKVSFKRWQRSQQSQRFDFTHDQIKKLIKKLGGEIPVLEKDLASELLRLVNHLQ